MVTDNIIQELRDKVTIRDAQLSQANQTANIESSILGALGKYYTNPPMNFNPCGCGCNSFCG